MSVAESLLVLAVLGLWVLAVINLAKKLERICNPPSIFPNYSLHAKASVCPSSRRDRRSNDSVQSSLPPPNHFIRATSEPAIDASPRSTIFVRSPSDTCLRVKSTSTSRMSTLLQRPRSPSAIELGKHSYRSSAGSLSIPRMSSYQIRNEISHVPMTKQTLLDPSRIPSIVRRSLLDLHRRTLFATPMSGISPIRCIVTAAGSNSNGNGPMTTTTTTATVAPQGTAARIPLLTRSRRANEMDEDDWYRGKTPALLNISCRRSFSRSVESSFHDNHSILFLPFFFFFLSQQQQCRERKRV